MPNIWSELDQMQREADRLFSGTSIPYYESYPAINMWVSADDVIVSAEIPGIDPGNIDISVEGEILALKGSRQSDALKEGGKFHRQERPHGMFKRKIRLPFRAEGEKVEAKYEKGVLTIKLPRAEADMPKKIEIKSV